MPRKVLILHHESRKSFLVLDWARNFKWLSIQFDKKEIAKITDKEEMKKGKGIALPPFGILRVKLIKQRLGLTSAFEVLLNDVPVHKSATDPIRILERNFVLIAIIAVINLAAGITAYFSPSGYLQTFGFGWESAAVGAIYLVLALLTRYAHSMIAALMLLTLFSLDFSLLIFVLFYTGYTNIWGLMLRVYLFTFLADNIAAIRELERQKIKSENVDVLDA